MLFLFFYAHIGILSFKVLFRKEVIDLKILAGSASESVEIEAVDR